MDLDFRGLVVTALLLAALVGAGFASLLWWLLS